MDADHLSTQARAAIDTLTQQLRHLEHQQTALLTSLHLTSSTLSTLPSYTSIAPTLAQIPHYETKLQRLKAAMAQQQRDVAELKRRALDAGARRRANLRRIEERRRGERERDRTVLRARVQQEEVPVPVPVPAEGGEREPEREVDQRAAGARTVKRKKKVRVAEIV